MNKSQFYLSECAQAAEKSPMCFKLGAVMVKGGKVISSGYNHHRPHYDGSRFKGPSGGFHSAHLQRTQVGYEQQQERQGEEKEKNHGRRSPKGAPLLKGVFQEPGTTKYMRKSRTGKKGVKSSTLSSASSGRGRGRTMKSSSSASPSDSSSGEASGSEDGKDSPARAASPVSLVPLDLGTKWARWDSRRRDSRMNGADLYVARITKNGCGNARPCWRCLEWCRWAGIKRIFHWNEVTNQFEVVKVNSVSVDRYETHADVRLFAGLGW